MDPFIHVRLNLTSDDVIDPTVITKRLGIDPTKTFVKGTERVSRNGQVYRHLLWEASGWSLSFYEQTVELPALLMRLVTMVEAVAEELADLRRELDLSAEISVHLKMADQTPIGTLDADLLRRLVALNVDLDLDLYVVDDDYEPVDPATYGIASSEVVEGYWDHYRRGRTDLNDLDWAWEIVEAVTHGDRSSMTYDPLDLIEALAEAAPSSEALAYLGAGPVEDLLARDDAQVFVDRVDELAGRHPKFRDALGFAYFDEALNSSDGNALRRWQHWNEA